MSNPENYTVGWICAILTEYVAAQEFLDEEHDAPDFVQPNDNNDYTLGRIGKHNVVVAVLPDGEYGSASAASVATNMLSSFPNVRIGLLVGIGGGAPSEKHDVRLGDIVVSAPRDGESGVFEYDFGKTIQNQAFQTTRFLNQPPTTLRTAVRGIQAQYKRKGHQLEQIIDAVLKKNPRLQEDYQRPPPDTDRLFQADFIHDPRGCAEFCVVNPSNLVQRRERTEHEDNPAIHYGTIASANQLMKDALIRNKLVSGKGVLCFEMEAAGLMNHFPCIVIRGICDYSDSHKNEVWQGYAAMAAAAYAKDLLLRILPSKVENEKRIIELLASVSNILEATKEEVQSLRTTILVVDQKTVFDRLPIAAGASFDSRAEEHNATCLPNTRLDLLRQLHEWANDPCAKALFWLNGMAGTGKSTISRTVARDFARSGHLGASFFFKRGEADRASLSMFFTSIATQLAQRVPAIASSIKAAIDADPNIAGKAVGDQFDKLIMQPLENAQQRAVGLDTLMLIIDALDECDQEEDVKLVIRLFSRTKDLQSPKLRIFVTSRPELPIRFGFGAVKGSYQDLVLHEIPPGVIKHDISIFLEHELARIRHEYNASVPQDRQLCASWPGQPNIQTLVTMAIPLFIFAATVCRFIADRRCGSPDEQLNDVLRFQTRSQESQLDALYLPILNKLIVGLSTKQRDKVLERFRKTVGFIVVLASPLSTSALGQILNVSKVTIDDQLDMLHSVLSVPSSAESPVRLLHLSFRDFLVGPEQREKNPFWIDEKQAHAEMAANCLRIMDSLKPDLCCIQSPGTPRSAVKPETIAACLPPDIQYSCLHWVHHMQHVERHDAHSEQVYRFLTRHFLHWVEALSLIGRTSDILGLIKTLQLLFKTQYNKQLSGFLEDASRFILAHISAIDSTPLQIYSSLLAFAPKSSNVRATFESKIPHWISLGPEAENDWGQCLQTLEGHGNEVHSVAFSHNSALIASASRDTTVRIWRVNTGECVRELKGHRGLVCSVVFSHNSTLIASASSDRTVRIWRADTGECVRELEGHSDQVCSVAFSHYSTLIASASRDTTVRIWRSDTGECVKELNGHSGWVCSVAFSHDSALIASASRDTTVRIWRADTGKYVRELMGHSDLVWSVAFSHDSALIASASGDATVRIWRADTGECVKELEGHCGMVRSVAFSHDSALIASASLDGTVRVWRADTGKCVRELEGYASVAFSHNSALIASDSFSKMVRIWRADTGEGMQRRKGHSDEVWSVVVSHNSALIASASFDQTVRIWRADTGECVQELKGHSGLVWSVMFSYDSILIASASSDGTVRIWRADTGECVRELEGHSDKVYSVVFSHNSTLIASASSDGTVRIWRVDTGECMRELKGHSNAVRSIAFSYNSALIASASFDQTVRIWRVDIGECVQELKGHSDQVCSVAFSHDSALIASASLDGTVRIWRTNTGEFVRELEGHRWAVESVAFSHNSALIASASQDETVRIWRADTGECMQEVYLGVLSTTLSFETTNFRLLTDVGAISIDGTTSMYSSGEPKAINGYRSGYRSGYGISQDRRWITWNGNNLLWLPASFRPSESRVSGSSVVIGCSSGRVIIFRFSSQELPELLYSVQA
ncbi:hypothetical protein MRS44_018089 [Fusarium solani]|uniref:uncharacterized protein n=1 Tax=Fusarium solani TaxID=169388 RepID=UPI0032C4372D|nr:hypothetical protein MRS44_018089 [Fusarium solani]